LRTSCHCKFFPLPLSLEGVKGSRHPGLFFIPFFLPQTSVMPGPPIFSSSSPLPLLPDFGSRSLLRNVEKDARSSAALSRNRTAFFFSLFSLSSTELRPVFFSFFLFLRLARYGNRDREEMMPSFFPFVKLWTIERALPHALARKKM